VNRWVNSSEVDIACRITINDYGPVYRDH
jgi:hypothetical protein